VKFAEKYLRGRASNKPEDIVHTLQQNLRGMYAGKPGAEERILIDLENKENVALKGAEIHGDRLGAILEARRARETAGQRYDTAAIIGAGIGNCFEHAVLACRYLNGIGIPSYIAETDDETNHVFVLLGLPSGLGGQTLSLAAHRTPGPPVGGAFSVVCDPWYHEWFGVQQDWSVKMHRILLTTNKRAGGQLPSRIPFTLTNGNRVT
jgi:hypothetical protein